MHFRSKRLAISAAVAGGLALSSAGYAQQSQGGSETQRGPTGPGSMGPGMMQGMPGMSGMGSGDMQQMMENCRRMMQSGDTADTSSEMKQMREHCQKMVDQPSGAPQDPSQTQPEKKN